MLPCDVQNGFFEVARGEGHSRPPVLTGPAFGEVLGHVGKVPVVALAQGELNVVATGVLFPRQGHQRLVASIPLRQHRHVLGGVIELRHRD